MSDTMLAAYIEQFGDRDVIKVGDLPKPKVGESEILVRIMYAGINPVDWKIRAGLLSERGIPHHFPLILGWDMSGIVEELGHSSRRFKEGEQVYAFCRRPIIEKGCYAQHIAIPETYLSRKPLSTSFETAAAIPLAALTAYQAIYEVAKLKKGETALIVGATGGVGTYAVQLCKLLGARVIAIAGSGSKNYASSLNADNFIDYEMEDFSEALIREIPEGVDFIFDCKGGHALDKEYSCVKSGGRLLSIVQRPAQKNLDAKAAKALYHFVEPNSLQLELIGQLIDSGKLRTNVSRVFKLKEAREAHEEIEKGHTKGKMVIQMDNL